MSPGPGTLPGPLLGGLLPVPGPAPHPAPGGGGPGPGLAGAGPAPVAPPVATAIASSTAQQVAGVVHRLINQVMQVGPISIGWIVDTEAKWAEGSGGWGGDVFEVEVVGRSKGDGEGECQAFTPTRHESVPPHFWGGSCHARHNLDLDHPWDWQD